MQGTEWGVKVYYYVGEISFLINDVVLLVDQEAGYGFI